MRYYGIQKPDLTPNEVFFYGELELTDPGTVDASTAAPLLNGERVFGAVDGWNVSGEALKWYLWPTAPGKLQLRVFVSVDPACAGNTVCVQVGGKDVGTFSTVASTGADPQPWDVSVTLPRENEMVCISFTAGNIARGDKIGNLRKVVMDGPLMSQAPPL